MIFLEGGILLSFGSNIWSNEWLCCVYFSIIILKEVLLVIDWVIDGSERYVLDWL